MKADLTSIIGSRFGRLLVLSFSHTSTAQHKDRVRVKYWFKCKCSCGNKVIIAKSCLTNHKGSTRSCGCAFIDGVKVGAAKQRGKPRPHVQKPNGASVLHTMFLAYKNGAKRRNMLFKISEEQFATLTSKNCTYCGAEPREIKSKKDSFATRKMNGIDRIDSNVGYIIKNCTTCCKTCNYMKQELSEKEFFEHLLKIKTFRSLS